MEKAHFDKIGDWTLRNPVFILVLAPTVIAAVVGYSVGGLMTAALSVIGFVFMAAFILTVNPLDPMVGPHQ